MCVHGTHVEYLGHKSDKHGLHPTVAKVEAIKQAPVPKDITQAFLGLVNYYSKFLLNLATTLAPLYGLLQKSHKWKWTQTEESAFQKVKSELSSHSY